MLTALVVLAMLSIWQVNNVRKRLDDIIDLSDVKERYAINFRRNIQDRSIALRDMLLVDGADLASVRTHIRELSDDYDASARPLGALISVGTHSSPAERTIYARIEAARVRSISLIGAIIARRSLGDRAGAQRLLMLDTRPAFVEWLAAVDALIDYEQAKSERQGEDARRISSEFRMFICAFTLFSTFSCIGLARWIVRCIGRTLGADPREAIAFADAIRNGHVAQKVELRANETSSVSATSPEIAQGHNDLSPGTVRQASSLESSTSPLRAFDASVAAKSGHAHEADLLARAASSIASDARTVLVRTSESTGGIRASSKRIKEIIGIVDAIAFQTDLLPPDAAVEAVRAGEQGRGFTVVASEVRTLAHRNANAAKEVRVLVEHRIGPLREDTYQVEAAGQTVKATMTASTSLTAIMRDINQACGAQTPQIDEVRTGIDHLEDATQRHAAFAEQPAAVTAKLAEQADSLLAAVDMSLIAAIDVFRLDSAVATRQNQRMANDLSRSRSDCYV
jgi:methyl-accepting chemotaxis protein